MRGRDNIKIDRTGWEGMNWIHLTQDRNKCDHSNEPLGSIKCGEFLV